MNSLEGRIRISEIKRSWVFLKFFTVVLISIACSLLIVSFLFTFFKATLWSFVPIFFLIFILASLVLPFWKITDQKIATYLNQNYRDLEESTELLLKNAEELSFLEDLQREKIDPLVKGIDVPREPVRKFWIAVAVMAAAVAVSLLISFFKVATTGGAGLRPSIVKMQPLLKERVLAEVSDFTVHITPPTYTRVSSRTQRQFYIKAENGASVKWTIKTNLTARQPRLIFNDKDKINFKSDDSEGKRWVFHRQINEPGFYQIEIDGKKSDLYQIEVIPDRPVEIKISSPKQHSTIDYGQPQIVNLKVALKDDYGIKDAFVAATMASGKGEGVSFTEKKLPFNSKFNNGLSQSLAKTLDLKALGMKPGDELYFYVNATDNYGQQSRSDVFFVSIVDTTELMSMAGMSGGVNLVPEYFRSQRQIIIDTEKLLKEEAVIGDKQFKEKSNEIGVDQKLLRLRYGKFLGEESETEIGGDPEHKEGDGHDHHEGDGHDHGEGKKQQDNVQSIMDQYAHKHDVAEDATFFEPELKAQLKAVLTEMWSSELRLRTYKPQDALPFEYKALRLLKDLQQKSRAYVAKTTYKTAQLKPEKRLSGELDKIISPFQQEKYKGKNDQHLILRKALAILESQKSGKQWNENELASLKEAEGAIIGAASGSPAVYLKALIDLRKLILSKKGLDPEVISVQRAIQRLIPREISMPSAQTSTPAAELYQNYYNNLKNQVQ